jgi:hypothetical protein
LRLNKRPRKTLGFQTPADRLRGESVYPKRTIGFAISDIDSVRSYPWNNLASPVLGIRNCARDWRGGHVALAIIDSVHCRSELEALIAVEIVATGFSGLRFLRQSHKNMTEEYVSVYGNYANKLLRLQLDLIQALDRHRRGHKQTVEVQHVHLHSGAQGVVGIVNAAGEDHATREGQK